MRRDTAAWEIASTAAERGGVTLRRLLGLEDADGVRSVIEAVWGAQIMPRELIRAFQHAGSILTAAEADGRMVGFVFGFVGFEPDLHVHSHMLGVLPEWQSRGVGFALKLAQRAESLDHGIDEVRWTYDPLIARNAHLNLVKLGTEAVALYRDFYGRMDDLQNEGDRSDRFEVRWRLRSERVERTLGGNPDAPGPAAPLLAASGDASAAGDAGSPRPEWVAEEPDALGATVAIPTDYQALRSRDPALGRTWRDTAATAFEACFRRGLVGTSISAGGTYTFEPG